MKILIGIKINKSIEIKISEIRPNTSKVTKFSKH